MVITTKILTKSLYDVSMESYSGIPSQLNKSYWDLVDLADQFICFEKSECHLRMLLPFNVFNDIRKNETNKKLELTQDNGFILESFCRVIVNGSSDFMRCDSGIVADAQVRPYKIINTRFKDYSIYGQKVMIGEITIEDPDKLKKVKR
jgi:hypothetical protein